MKSPTSANMVMASSTARGESCVTGTHRNVKCKAYTKEIPNPKKVCTSKAQKGLRKDRALQGVNFLS